MQAKLYIGRMKNFRRAKGRTVKHVPGVMNRLERDYDDHLEFEQMLGNIFSRKFESVKLRLADRTFYTPDFMVITDEGFVEFHEVKGFWEEDARVKIKVAAEQYPSFAFIAIMRNNKTKEWKKETF